MKIIWTETLKHNDHVDMFRSDKPYNYAGYFGVWWHHEEVCDMLRKAMS